MKPQAISTEIRPGVTDVRTIGEHVAITDHTRVIDDERWIGYAVQYSSPIGPELPATPRARRASDYVRKPVRELHPGELVSAHGMICLVVDVPKLSSAHVVDERGGCYWTETLVLNRADVSSDAVPHSFTAPREVWSEDARRWVRPGGQHRWTLQGNDLAREAVLVHGPELPRFIVKRYRQGEAAPSMSLSYRALTAEKALHEHFKAYRSGVADGERFAVTLGDQWEWFETTAARSVARQYV